ncbi:MAG: hypothetical protein WED82_01640 [Balneolales bacterium]
MTIAYCVPNPSRAKTQEIKKIVTSNCVSLSLTGKYSNSKFQPGGGTNAEGEEALIEMASLYKDPKVNKKPKRTIRIIAKFTGLVGFVKKASNCLRQ